MANDTFGGEYFANLLQSDTQNKVETLRGSFLNGVSSNPEAVAQALPLAKKTGLPLQTVENNKAAVEKRDVYNADYFANLMRRAPNTAAFFQSVDNSKIAHDDLGNLENIEGFFANVPKPIVAVSDTLGAAPVGGAISGIGLAARGIGSSLRDISNFVMQDRALGFMGRDMQMMAIMGGLSGDILKQSGKVIGDVGEAISPPKERQNFVTQVAGGVGQISGQLAAYAINPVLGTTQLIGQGAGQQSDRLDKQGITDTETRLMAQGLGAGATYATERIGLEVIKGGVQSLRISTSLGKEAVPVGKLLENAPGMSQLMQRLPDALKNKWLLRAVDVSAAGAGEAVQEATEGFLQNLIEQTLYNPDAELIAGLKDEASVAGASGAVARAILMGVTRGRISQLNNDAPEPEAVKEWVTNTNAEVQKSNLLRRSPEKFREYVQENYGDDRFYVDAEVAETLYQSLPPAEQARLEEVVPGFAQSLEEARLSGADMEMSRADYFSYVAPLDQGNTLADYIKLDPEHYSVGQIRDAQEFMSESLVDQDVDTQGLEPNEQIERRYYDQLLDAGQTPDAARLNASRMRKAYETFSTRYGENNQQAADLIDKMLGELVVERRFADLNKRVPVNDMDLFIDRVRNFRERVANKITGAEKRRATAVRKAQEKAAATGQPFKMPRLARSRKSLDRNNYPMLDFIARRGGVNPDSGLAGELRAIGVDQKNAPWLFTAGREGSQSFFGSASGARGGMGALDTVSITDFREYFDTEPVAAPTSSTDSDPFYVDQGYILDQVREEIFGNPLIGREQNAEEALFDDFLRVVDELGLDIDTASNQQIKDALAQAQAQMSGADTLYQDGGNVRTESPEFKAWFGDSKVVDSNGAPLVVYHGTDKAFTRVNMKKGAQGLFWFTSDKKAIEAGEVGASGKGVIMEMYASIKNPAGWNEYGKFGIGELIGRGYDGAILPDGDGSFVGFIFEPNQVKSVNNRGTFSSDDANMLRQDGTRGRGPRGQIDFLDDMTARITLWEGANLSTLIHEEGHLYWRLLSRIAGLPEAAQAFPNAVKDAETIRKWVKAEPGQRLNVDQEEQIARGFEAWIMGGQAPSIELQDAFQRFKGWLVSIYTDIKNLGVTVTDDVAQVFERMLATDQEIELMRDNQEFRMNDQIMQMLTKSEQDRYQRQYDRAVNEAKDKLLNKAIKEVTRQNKQFYKEERAKLLEENNSLLDQSPLYRAVEFLQKGVFKDTAGQVVEGVAPVKLDRKAVISIMGKEVLEYLPSGILTTRSGMNPDVFAEMFGYDSGAAMLRPMMNFIPRKERVQQMTDQDLKSRYGDMLNDGTIEREAVESFHNDYRQYLLELEVKTLAKAAKLPVPQGVSFKIRAEELIGSKLVRDLIPYRYYRASVKAARAAGVALGKGDYVTAAVEKQRQLLNHHLYMMAQDNRKLMDRKFRQWRKITTRGDKDTAKSRDIDYIYAARAILARNNIGRSNFNFASWMDNLRQDDPDTADMMQQTIDTYAAAPKDYRDMTWEEFQALADAVDNIMTIAKERRTVEVEGQKRDLDEVAAEIAGTIYANVPMRQDQDPRESTMIGNSVEGLSNIATKMITWTEQIDGGRNGIFYQAVQKIVRQAEIVRAQRQRGEAIKLAALYEKYYGGFKIGDYTATFEQMASSPSKRMLSDATGGRLDLTGKVYIPELNRSLSREEILSAAFNYGNEDNAVKFMEGMAKDPKFGREWDEDQYLAVLSRMRDKDWDFVVDATNQINSFWAETVALDRRTKGFAPPKIQGRPFSIVTADGNTRSFEGWYYPVKYSADKSSRMSGKILEQDLKELAAGQRSFAATKQGRLKERQESSGEPVRMDLDVIAQAIEEAVTDITMREAVLNSRKLLGHKDVREAIDATLGPKVYSHMTMWLQDVASGPMLTDGAVGALMRGFRSSMSAAAMGFKISTAMLQPTGVIQAIPEIGSSWMARGFYNYMTAGRTGPWSAAEQVRQLSPFMQVRVYNQNREASEAFRRAQRGGFVNDVEGKLYWLMQKLQQIPDTIIWMAAYERAQAPKSKGGQGLTGAAAVDYADLAVETTQGGGLQSSLSAVERGSATERVRQAELVKSLTVLYSYMNAKYNTYRRIRNKYDQSDRGILDKAHLGADLFLIMTVETLIGALILGRAPDFDDEDDPTMAAFLYGIQETLKTFLSTLPIIGYASSFIDGFEGQSATQRGVGEIVNSGKVIGQELNALFDEDEEFNAWKAARAVNTGGIYLSPIKWPSSQVNVMLRAAESQSNGDDVTPIDYLIYRPSK